MQAITTPDNPQSMFQNALDLERDMSELAAQAANASPRGRQDAVARLTVAAEGVAILFASILKQTELAPDSIPFREDWEQVLDRCLSRLSAFKQFMLRGDFTVGALANVSTIVAVTEEPIAQLVGRLQGIQAAGVIHAFILWGLKDDG